MKKINTKSFPVQTEGKRRGFTALLPTAVWGMFFLGSASVGATLQSRLELSDRTWKDSFQGVWRLDPHTPTVCSNGEEITEDYFRYVNSLTSNYKYTIDEDDDEMTMQLSFTFAGLVPVSMEYSIKKTEGEESSFRFVTQPSFSAESHGSDGFYLEKYGEDSLVAFLRDDMNFCEGDFTVIPVWFEFSGFISFAHPISSFPRKRESRRSKP